MGRPSVPSQTVGPVPLPGQLASCPKRARMRVTCSPLVVPGQGAKLGVMVVSWKYDISQRERKGGLQLAQSTFTRPQPKRMLAGLLTNILTNTGNHLATQMIRAECGSHTLKHKVDRLQSFSRRDDERFSTRYLMRNTNTRGPSAKESGPRVCWLVGWNKRTLLRNFCGHTHRGRQSRCRGRHGSCCVPGLPLLQ